MNKEIQQFIEENINLIQDQRWEEIYKKEFPYDFTEILLESGINPLEQGLNYVPNWFLCECKSIKKFTIPDNVTSICYFAFDSCDSLTNIVIPDSVTSIGDSAFYYCDTLTSIEIPKRETSIGYGAFNNCTSLTSIIYKGTKKEALNKLKVKDKEWRKGSAISKIICTDGVIEL